MLSWVIRIFINRQRFLVRCSTDVHSFTMKTEFKSSLRRNVFRKLIIISSLIGFLTQVTQMSTLYFKYATTTQVTFTMRTQIQPHSLVLCVRYNDILDRERLFKETGIEVNDVTDIVDAMSQQSKLTVRQMFEYTPSGDDAIHGCFYRPSDWTMVTSDREVCNRLFKVTRYVTQEFMCYAVYPVNVKVIGTDAVTMSHFKQFVTYDILMSPVFDQADHVVPIAFFKEYPYISRSYSEVVILRKESKTLSGNDYNLINIFPNEFVIRQLEKPYDTGCIPKDQDEYWICRRDCLMGEFVDKLDRLPLTEIMPESDMASYDMRLVSTTDFENQTFADGVTDTYRKCNHLCAYNPCEMTYTKTSFRPLTFQNFSLMLSSMTPTEADVSTESQARMTFVEFFSFICGCFGTWFGLSFASLFRSSRRFVKKKREKNSSVMDEFYRDKANAWRQIRSQKMMNTTTV